jgi:hypothetical protein
VLTKVTPQSLTSDVIDNFLANNPFSIDRRLFNMIDKGLDPSKYSVEDFNLFNTNVNEFIQRYPNEDIIQTGKAQDYGMLQRPSLINVSEEEKQKMRFKLIKEFLSLSRTDRALRATKNSLTKEETGFEQ